MARRTVPVTEHLDRPTDRPAGDHPHEDRGRAAEKPSEIPARGWKDVLKRVKQQVGEDRISLSAAGVAFFAFLSLIPGLAAVVSVYGLVADPDQVEERVTDLLGTLPAEAQDLLTSQLEDIVGQSSSALTIGLLVSLALALWTASSGMANLVEAVNAAYGETGRRKFVKARSLALVLTIGAVVFLVLAIGTMTVVPNLIEETGLPDGVQWLLNVLVWPVLGLAFVAALGVLYRVAPVRADPRWRWVSWGSVAALAIWLVASIGFQVYAGNFGSYNETYGSLAAVVLLMLWLYISAFAVLLGAEINAEIEHQTTVDTTVGPEEPMGVRGAYVADTLGS